MKLINKIGMGLLCVLSVSTLASTDQNRNYISVFEVSGHGEMRDYSAYASFDYSRKEGEASVVIIGREDCFPDDFGHSCMGGRSVADYVVPGLLFDKSVGDRGAIVYRDGETTTVCAKLKWRGLRWHWTGNCELELTQYRGRDFFNYTLRFLVKAK